MRKTSKEYKTELESLRLRQEVIENRIKVRLVEMVEQNPDAIILERGEDKFKAKCVTKSWVEGLSTDTMIEFISAIEKHNSQLEPYVQVSMYD